jgi:hypothetical protein
VSSSAAKVGIFKEMVAVPNAINHSYSLKKYIFIKNLNHENSLYITIRYDWVIVVCTAGFN